MNFLDAHKIINDYIDVSAATPTTKVARRLSVLKETKENILIAYKLFVSHMFAFNTRTQHEYENLYSLMLLLPIYVDDEIVDGLEECEKIINSRGIARLKNKSAIPFAEEKFLRLSKEVLRLSELSCIKAELSGFEKEIMPAAESLSKALNTMPTGTRETMNKRFEIIGQYCCEAYRCAGIKMEEDDVDYFLPFSVLRRFSEYPSLGYLYDRYKDYIFLNN